MSEIREAINWWENDLTPQQRKKLHPESWQGDTEERHFKLLQMYLTDRYGSSQSETNVMGINHKFTIGNVYTFKDGSKSKLVHIEYRNMAVDLLRFVNGKEIFTGDIVKNIKLKEALE